MADLGAFGVAAREQSAELDTFTFCGERFTVGQVGLVPLGMFAHAAVSGLDTAEMEGMAALVDVLSDLVTDEDRARFLATAKRNRANVDDLLPIVKAIIAAQTGNPTQRPSVSSGGPSTTGASSPGLSPFGPVPPIQMDPRVQALRPVTDVAASLVG